jgi:hypothetical protein
MAVLSLPEPIEPAMTGADFMVDWPKLRGQRVTIVGGTVSGAQQSAAVLQVAGGFVVLLPPWEQREELRYLFQNCAGMIPLVACRMAVTGDVSPTPQSTTGWPQ